MESLIIKLLEQLPSTAAVVIVVIVFTKFITKRDAVWQRLHNEEIAEHLEARRTSREAIERNTDAMLKNIEASTRLSDRLSTVEAVCPMAKVTPGDSMTMLELKKVLAHLQGTITPK